jgi:FlaA1/EpsC-like NDP-sugar epimerase
MGEPVRIPELARDLIRLHVSTEDQIRIVFTGLRPGEKLYVELLAAYKTTTRMPHPKLRVARAKCQTI